MSYIKQYLKLSKIIKLSNIWKFYKIADIVDTYIISKYFQKSQKTYYLHFKLFC